MEKPEGKPILRLKSILVYTGSFSTFYSWIKQKFHGAKFTGFIKASYNIQDMIHDTPLCDTLYKQRAHLLILKMLIVCRDNLASVSRDSFFPDLEIKLRV